jgi:single-stranded DNA-specific DHH superfamily exonuclease
LPNISLDSLAELDQLKPMGQGNPALQFFATKLTHHRPLLRMGAEKQHVKLWVTDGKIFARSGLVECRQWQFAGRKIRSRLRAADQ